ncbi:sugar kinase [Streptomyces triticirhizae]|uniref:Sugar kinase n=1 Tax=Streptomyces triticirhizae TaxID=2483353 RepID=A0A3M2M0N3_9ACTN|nr:sugar kinase [Streptomyces triticirhizae]RMI41945.1 sugar kinase [Streptomyces triticirhizae]
MSGTAEIVVCGEAMTLLLAEPGVPLEHATAFRRSIAGAESNVAAGLARLGHRSRWLGRVGDDPAGRAVLAKLRSDGIDTSYAIVDSSAFTGMLVRDSHPARAIDVQYYRAGSAASRLRADELRPEALAGARLLHVTGITPMLSGTTREATERLFELARDAGALVSFDPNIRLKVGPPERWREVVGPLLERADLVLAGEDELELLHPDEPTESARRRLLASGAGAVVIKHRDKSASCHTADGAWRQEAFTVPVVDPVGAGDAFAVGFLDGWLAGATPALALEQAAATAALVVQSANDTDGLPDRPGLDRALRSFTQRTEAVNR